MDEAENKKHREQVWKHLRQQVAKIPQQNSLIIGGDFNCTVRRSKELIGSAIIHTKEETKDMEEFLGFLQDFGLSLLNTWQCKPAHTCVTSGFKSQLNFLIA